jgi:hypothetical protein
MDVQNLVVEFLVVQKNKGDTITTLGHLQPLSIPSQRWVGISMDFIMGLTNSEGNNVIMILVYQHGIYMEST